MSAPSGSTYFVRMNGKMLGPFGLIQLQSFRDKGRLRREHELSVDRESWFEAGRIPELFASIEAPQTYAFAAESSSTAPQDDEWYVEIDGERRGPLSIGKLRSLLAAGKVADDDLVWKTGLRDWKPAEDFQELFTDSAPSPNGQGTRKKRRQRDGGTGLWDRFLDAVRQTVTEDDLERICRSMLGIGRVGMLLGAFAVSVFLGIRAVTANQLSEGLMAAALGLSLLGLQYVGARMAAASQQLAVASKYRLSSTAFPRSIAVLLLAMGVLLSVSLVALQIERAGLLSRLSVSSNEATTAVILGVVMAIEIFLPFLYGFFAALHPQWMMIECDQPVSAGEEGIGSIAFLLKVGLRFVPVSYGVSALLGSLGMIAALAMYFAGPAMRQDAIGVAAASQKSLIAAAVVPIVWYMLASLASIILDYVLPNVRATTNASQKEA